jgi:hypothetical protein
MKHLAGLVLLAVLLISPSCKWLKSKGILGKKEDTLVAWNARQDSLRVIDSVRKAQELLISIENAKRDSIKMVQDRESQNKFNIIIGSFITPEYARKYSADFNLKGYKTKIMKLEGTKFEMVSAESYPGFRTAVNRLRQFQDTVISDAWIYVYKGQN